jgi:hypothetical protein
MHDVAGSGVKTVVLSLRNAFPSRLSGKAAVLFPPPNPHPFHTTGIYDTFHTHLDHLTNLNPFREVVCLLVKFGVLKVVKISSTDVTPCNLIRFKYLPQLSSGYMLNSSALMMTAAGPFEMAVRMDHTKLPHSL